VVKASLQGRQIKVKIIAAYAPLSPIFTCYYVPFKVSVTE